MSSKRNGSSQLLIYILLAVGIACIPDYSVAHSHPLLDDRTQNWSELTDDEVQLLVSNHDDMESLEKWSVSSPADLGKRLPARYLTTSIGSKKELYAAEFEAWCLAQTQIGKAAGLEQRIGQWLEPSNNKDLELLGPCLSEIALDPFANPRARIIAVLATTSPNSAELRDCLAMLMLNLAQTSGTAWDDEFELMARVLRTTPEMRGLSKLAVLLRTLQNESRWHDSPIDHALADLRNDDFCVPFVLEEGSGKKRTLRWEPNEDERISLEADQSNITDLAILEKFRCNDQTTYARQLRYDLFNNIFGLIKVLYRDKPTEERAEYFHSICGDLSLLVSRMMQCDSEYEQLASTAHFCDCMRCADLQPKEIAKQFPSWFDHPSSREAWELCRANVEEDFASGRNENYFYRHSQRLAKLGKEWEEHILSNF